MIGGEKLDLDSLLLVQSAKDFQILLYDRRVEMLTLSMRALATFSGILFLEQKSLRYSRPSDGTGGGKEGDL